MVIVQFWFLQKILHTRNKSTLWSGSRRSCVIAWLNPHSLLVQEGSDELREGRAKSRPCALQQSFSFQCPSQQHKNLLRTKQSTERSRGQGRDEDRKTCPLGRGQVRREAIPPASASPGSRSNTHSFPSDLSVTIKFPLTSGQLSPSTYIPGPFFPALALLSLH